jgi:hypothetical protein
MQGNIREIYDLNNLFQLESVKVRKRYSTQSFINNCCILNIPIHTTVSKTHFFSEGIIKPFVIFSLKT